MQNQVKQIREQIGITQTIQLNVPVQLADGRELNQVTMRRAKVGDLRSVSHYQNEAEQEIALIARLAGLIPEDLEELDLSDYVQLQDWFRQCQQKPKTEIPKIQKSEQ
ncbi:phage tail assembly protein [Alysiella crassa]|uniref:Phage tail protein E n=2 Tax=Alysiella crassa TaxID=153491 RepID=A0A376BTM2_9NEIS|nr:phage tail assembly protein [Alysiella crassa]UOP08202.1 phage tail assembly protein [Alysiella crassa]SSY80133.1 Uncharacterised protein [Alysiella crassa]